MSVSALVRTPSGTVAIPPQRPKRPMRLKTFIRVALIVVAIGVCLIAWSKLRAGGLADASPAAGAIRGQGGAPSLATRRTQLRDALALCQDASAQCRMSDVRKVGEELVRMRTRR
ncbi:MAG TPA: hypothetical protein VE967_01090 [Gemmatimonadaceae bacterium]|nr:hypothetical protein [Gemmatimonadaceae bacterium]